MLANYFLFAGQAVYAISSFLSSRRIYMRKSSEDFSMYASIAGYLGVLCLFGYSIEIFMSKGVWALLIQNCINVFMNTINTCLVLYYHPHRKR